MRVRPAVPLRWVSQSVARLHLVFVPEESMSPCTTPSHSLVQVSPAAPELQRHPQFPMRNDLVLCDLLRVPYATVCNIITSHSSETTCRHPFALSTDIWCAAP